MYLTYANIYIKTPSHSTQPHQDPTNLTAIYPAKQSQKFHAICLLRDDFHELLYMYNARKIIDLFNIYLIKFCHQVNSMHVQSRETHDQIQEL